MYSYDMKKRKCVFFIWFFAIRYYVNDVLLFDVKRKTEKYKKNTINVNYFYHMHWISQSVKNKT